MILAVAPHLDDAVCSVTQSLVDAPGSTVVTLFAGEPGGPHVLTDHDRASGFTSAAEAIVARRKEDRRACAILHAQPLHLDFVDSQYGDPRQPELLESVLTGLLCARGDQEVLAPVGLSHPDHLATIEALLNALDLTQVTRWWAYEELPYRVLWPDLVEPALDRIRARGWTVLEPHPPAAPPAIKLPALECYRSQLHALWMPAPLAPERLHDCTR